LNAIKLNRRNLVKIGGVARIPEYKREGLKTAIVHLGLGHFHRAHQAVYLDRLLQMGAAATGLFEINLIKDSRPLAEIAAAQDYLYSLLSGGACAGEEFRIIGSIRGYVNAAENQEAALAALASAETSVISMTITEKGYYWDAVARAPDWKAAPLAHDLENPERPRSAAGLLSRALKRRFAESRAPVTIMSCDNFPANGKTLKTIILSFCRELYPEIVPWIEDNAAFPCSMVDRITPNTSAETIRYIEEKYGVADSWAVRCEDYLQWVLEDDFRFPPGAAFDPADYAIAGAQITGDVEPYEIMKQTLLNGSHSALAYLACLLGYTAVADAVADPDIRRFIRDFYMEEMTAALPPVMGIDLNAYKDTLLGRFGNRAIGDTVLRLAEDGSKKIPNFILRPLVRMIREGKPHDAPVLALAGWARFLAGTDENGKPIPVQDPDGGAVVAAAQKALEAPAAFLRAAGVPDLSDTEMAALAEMFSARLGDLRQQGVRKTLAEAVH
jgi:mannitol-1-phosphate/altronate dehydrogenase